MFSRLPAPLGPLRPDAAKAEAAKKQKAKNTFHLYLLKGFSKKLFYLTF